MAELMDVYDENRNFTGLQLDRKTAFLKEGQFMLYVLAILENSEGKILITQRALDKKWAAGSWEIPGGGSMAGESSYQAVCREVLEETGLDILKYMGDTAQSPIDSYRNIDLKRGDNYFVDIYHFRFPFTDQDVSIEKRESIAWRCADLSEITEIKNKEGFLHYERILHALEKEKAS